MKHRFGWLNDPSLHLIAITTALMGAVVAFNARSWWSPRTREVVHPPGCHACSICSHEAVAARDAFLIRTGSIAPPDTAE
jgi:hypothetical protein